MTPQEAQQLLADDPEFKRKLAQFMTLYDAAQVLGELHWSYSDNAAFLRMVGNHIMQEAGIPDEFVEAMIKARPEMP